MSTATKVTHSRPRHVPQRTCVACRHTTTKRELVRIVRVPEGGVEVDPTGKRSGRGAYLCPTPDCWRLAVQKSRLDRALKTNLSAADKEALLQYAQGLTPGVEA
jgi:hypothetical protein